MTNIVLIGMPAGGKSTVGVLLAKALGYDFLDTDLLIQSKTGKRLPELIAARGIDGFLALENEMISGVAATRTVIATGGSAVFGAEAMTRLHTLGRVVYLRLPVEEIARRVGNITTRGVVAAPGETVEDIYRCRAPLYEAAADIIVDTGGLTVEQAVAAVMAAVE